MAANESSDEPAPGLANEAKPKGHIVHAVHGILTHADWGEMLTQCLEQDDFVEVEITKYGKFDLLSFLLPGPSRRWPVNKTAADLVSSFTRAQSEGKLLSVIAHSNGTYATYKALQMHPNIELEHLVLCGSIIEKRNVLANIKKASVKKSIVNDYGTRDVWPAVAASITWGYGNGGTYGLGSPARNRRHPFGHSDFFSREFVEEFWRPLFGNDKIIRRDYKPYPTHPFYFRLFDFPFRWLLASALVVSALWLSVVVASAISADEAAPKSEPSSQPVDSVSAFLSQATISTPRETFSQRLSSGSVREIPIGDEEAGSLNFNRADGRMYTPIAGRHVIEYRAGSGATIAYVGDGTDTPIPGLYVPDRGSTSEITLSYAFSTCQLMRVPDTSAHNRVYFSGCFYGNPGSYNHYGYLFYFADIRNCLSGTALIEMVDSSVRTGDHELLGGCGGYESSAIGFVVTNQPSAEESDRLVADVLYGLATYRYLSDDHL